MIWFHVRSRTVLRLFYEQTAQNKRCSPCSALSAQAVMSVRGCSFTLFDAHRRNIEHAEHMEQNLFSRTYGCSTF